MADPKNSTFPHEDVTKEAISRLADARAQKTEARDDVREALFFTRPRLCWDIESTRKTSKKRNQEEADLATGIGAEVSEDFATEVISAFFPEGTNWVESTPDLSQLQDIEEAEKADIEAAAKTRNETIFSAIRASNFDSELGATLDPHASIGTVAWWIDKKFNTKPAQVSGVPYKELEFNVEPDGSVGDRFRVRWVRVSKLDSVIPDVTLPEAVRRKVDNDKKGWIEVVWAFWRDWSDPENEVWKHVLLVDRVAVHEQILEGEGCLPLLIARFSPDTEYSWGFGPSIKALQDYRVLDVITAATQDRIDIAIAPPIGYPDDGVTDFEGGIEAAKAYPMRPGSGRDVTKLYFEGDPDLGFYTATDLERRIRRKHFADYPEQKGDTPPTATQWIDEMVKSQRRIGTPGKKFWREGPYQVFRRFEWLLDKDGKLEDIEFNGQALALIPNNPATQAANNQKLQNGMQVLGIIKSYFPETAAAAVDGRVQADQIDASYRDELNSTLANIKAIRSSAGVGSDSPTGQAVEADQMKKSNRDRIIDVGSKRMQATQDENDAKFRRSAARMSLIGGVAKSIPSFFGA